MFFITNSTETYINSVAACGTKGGKLYEPRDAVTYFELVKYLEVKLVFKYWKKNKFKYKKFNKFNKI